MFLNKKDDKAVLPEEEVKKLMDGHMANIGRLAKEGKLWAAGPFDGGGGIFLFKTSSMEDVKSWILTDPAVKAGRWNVEIFPYFPRTGSVCSVGETYEMTNYFFVRYTQMGMEQDQSHRDYLLSSFGSSLLGEGKLGKENGSIAIFRDEPKTSVLDSDPLVRQTQMTYSLKKLFIAKGSFCEPK